MHTHYTIITPLGSHTHKSSRYTCSETALQQSIPSFSHLR
uniref:Uncharacterized protein n=1 Tax=Anguilla anguilla TaxID=7936 RepID=A0A0E9UG56_ANGAN